MSIGKQPELFLLKGPLFSSDLWGINYKSLGDSIFGTQNTQILNSRLALKTVDGALVRKYGWRIAQAMEQLFDINADNDVLYNVCDDVFCSSMVMFIMFKLMMMF